MSHGTDGVDAAPLVSDVAPPAAVSVGRVRGALNRQRVVVNNTASLAMTTASTAVLGIGYWAVAARELSPTVVGLESALISAMTLAGTVGMLGMGSLLIAELGNRGEHAARLLCTVLAATSVFGLLAGAVALVSLLLSNNLSDAVRPGYLAVIFVVGVSTTAVTLVFDQATIGLLAGHLQMWRNLAMGAMKVLLLVWLVTLGTGLDRYAVLVSWVTGTILSVPLVAIIARRRRIRLWARPHWHDMSELKRASFDHTMLTLSSSGPRLAMPLLVALTLSPRANAAFYIAWVVASMLYLIPGHLSTVLFAVAKGNAAELRSRLRFTLTASAALGVPVCALAALLAKPMLSVFGSHYAAAGVFPIQMFVLAFPGNVVKLHYMAVARVKDQLAQAWRVLFLFAVVEVATVVLASRGGGLDQVALALAVVMIVEGLITLPMVVAAVRPPGAHRASR